MTLVLREGQDTSNIVAFGAIFFFGEVADKMAAVFVAGAHDVEEEGVDVIVEGFVIQEELGEETQVTAPSPLAAAIHFEEGYVVVTVDLVAGRVIEGAFLAVTTEGFF